MVDIDVRICPKNIQSKNKSVWKNTNKIWMKKTNKKRENKRGNRKTLFLQIDKKIQ